MSWGSIRFLHCNFMGGSVFYTARTNWRRKGIDVPQFFCLFLNRVIQGNTTRFSCDHGARSTRKSCDTCWYLGCQNICPPCLFLSAVWSHYHFICGHFRSCLWTQVVRGQWKLLCWVSTIIILTWLTYCEIFTQLPSIEIPAFVSLLS